SNARATELSVASSDVSHREGVRAAHGGGRSCVVAWQGRRERPPPGASLPSPGRSVEDVGDVEAEDVLSGQEDGVAAGGKRPLAGFVVAVLHLAVEVLGDQVLARDRPLVNRLHEARAAPAVVLEPLAADRQRRAFGEVVVADRGQALPEG